MKQIKGSNPRLLAAPVLSKEELLCGVIAKEPFFKGLKKPHLMRLAALAMRREFKAGEVIFNEGDPANRFYLILQGKAELLYDDEHIPVLGPGEDLGWSWLFPPYYFRVTARSLEPVKTIFFYGTRLRQQCDDDHDFGYEIMKRIAQVAIQHLNIARKNAKSAKMKSSSARRC